MARNRILLYLVLFSALLRFGYLIFGDVLPVAWDSRRYSAAAIGIISQIDRSVAPDPLDEKTDRQRFQYYTDKYLDGERIVWDPYFPHRLSVARDDIMIGGPLYPAIVAAIIVVSPVADFTMVRIFGILLDLLSVLFLYLVVKRLLSERAALIAGLAYAIYFPFINTSTMLLLETSTNTLLLLGLWLLLKAVDSGRAKWWLWAGVVSGLMVLNKPSASLLALPLGGAALLFQWGKVGLKQQIRDLAPFATPFLVVMAVWVTMATLKYGQLTLREPTYQEAGLRHSSSTEYEGYDLDWAPTNFWDRGVYADLFEHPLDYAGLFIKKYERLFGRPYNDFKRSFILPYMADESLHVILLFFGAIGLIGFAVTDWRGAAWPALIILYYLAIHIVYHAVSRYSFSAIPLLFVGIGWIGWRLSLLVNRRQLLELCCGAAALLLSWKLSYHAWEYLGISLSTSWVILTLFLRTILFAVGTYLIARVVAKTKIRTTAIVVLTACLYVPVMWVFSLDRDRWAEFSTTIEQPGDAVGTRIYISDPKPFESGATGLIVDVRGSKDIPGFYSLSIGSSSQPFVVGSIPAALEFFHKRNYEFFLPMAYDTWKGIPQYAVIALPSGLIAGELREKGFVDVRASFRSITGEQSRVTLGGIQTATDTGVVMPSFSYKSIERYVDQGDPRIRTYAKFSSDSARSYYIGPTSPEQPTGDLSPSPAVQRGRYHIYLLHYAADSSLSVF